jgi:predicted DNA-binding ribbon-helix-helix protein
MSIVAKRSIVIADRKTSVSLEDQFWSGLREISLTEGKLLKNLVTEIDSQRAHGNLSCATRLCARLLSIARPDGLARRDGCHERV